MAEVAVAPDRTASSWLDRPLVPTWQRIAALTINWEFVAYATILLIGFTLRIWDVGARAVHHDESLHAYYSWKFFAGQGYSYDPLMHGPFQFQVVPLFYLLFGVSDFSARLLAVTLGTVMIPLPYFLRSHITRPGAVLASAMLAISPAMVYYSRFIRDDIYLACFTLILFIALLRYVERPRPYLLYIAAAAAALAMASIEAAYITFFIFGSFLIFEAVRELLVNRDGPVLSAVRSTSLDTWLTALSIFIVIIVLFYSTFFTNPYGIWDTQHPLLDPTHQQLINPNRQDILGGLAYWQAQQPVERGGQPWFYYLLLMPLYEQLALLFGSVGLVYAVTKRSLAVTFLAWWAVMSYALYTWAGEKMPWLVIHITLPLMLLGGLFLGKALQASWRTWIKVVIGGIAVLLAVLEIHSTLLLNFVDGANPTEMLIYVQSSQDVKTVTHEIERLSPRVVGNSMPIGLDDADVGGWPFIWYLRNYTNITETSTFNGPICGGQYCPVLLMLGPEYDQYSPQLLQHYVVQKYRWNWWFPEDYKVWFPQHWGAIPRALQGHGALAADILGTPTDWTHIWDWLVYRRPFGDRGARILYFLVRRDLVPGAKSFSTGPAGTAPQQSLPAIPATLAAQWRGTGAPGGPLQGPRGIAAAPNGNTYVADTLNHRVVELSRSGKTVTDWGSAGTAPGQFASLSSPQGLAVGANGDVYVTDTWNQRIEVFDAQGRFLRSWGGGPIGAGPGQFYGPRSVAVSPSGRVYVADTGNKRIEVFTDKGKYLSAWGSAGTGPGQFQEPSSVVLGRNGNVYVADFWNQRIQEFTAAGQFIRQWRVPDWTPQAYDEPYLTVDPRTGNVLATEPQQQRIVEWTSVGTAVGTFGSGKLTDPIGVAAGPSGRIMVSDATANTIDLFNLSPPRTAGRAPARAHTRTTNKSPKRSVKKP